MAKNTKKKNIEIDYILGSVRNYREKIEQDKGDLIARLSGLTNG